MSNQSKKLCDVMSVDLAGFQLVLGYFLELEHSLMGFFPAVFRDQVDRIILCTDSALLDKVEAMLVKRRHKRKTILVIVHVEQAIGFDLSGRDPKSDLEAWPILTEEEFMRLTAGGKNPFRWAPGLVSDDMAPEEFVDTLKLSPEKEPHF